MTERDIFLGALDEKDPAARSAFLDKTCAGQPELRRRIEDLLQCHHEGDTFLEVSAVQQVAGDDGALASLAPARAPDVLGRLDHYDVLEVVGRGATGVVLKARDTKLQRIVAVKMLAPRLAASATARARFVREAQAAAAVRDDNVVAIHAVSDEGRAPYLVMEYVSGTTLEARVKEGVPLELKETLRVGMQIAMGLAAAHTQGVVHRDIKPANVLLENGVQRVKITDFGLARAWEGDEAAGLLAGTPLYMSPEQAGGEPTDQGTDLFSLGSVLYTLCAGRPPFRADTVAEILKCVREAAPAPLRGLKPDVPEWLCQLIDKLHAKKPYDRFTSAREVADLLSARLASLQQPHAPATPTATVLQASKLDPNIADVSPKRSRKRRFPLPWLAALALIVAVCAYIVWLQMQGADNQPEDESLLPDPLELRREDIPPNLLTLAGGGDPRQAPSELVAVLGDGRFLFPRYGGTAWFDQSPDGKILEAPLHGDVVLFEASTGDYLRSLKGPGGRVIGVTFSRDGQLLAAIIRSAAGGGAVRTWDLHDDRELYTHAISVPHIFGGAAFSGDGKRLVTEGPDVLQVWDARSGQRVQAVQIQPGGTIAMCFSPDGRRLATAVFFGKRVDVFDWDGEKLTPLGTLQGHRGTVCSVAYSPDGKYLASGDNNEFKLWQAASLEEVRTVERSAERLAFTPDSGTLFAATTTDKERATHTFARWAVSSQEDLPALPLAVSGPPSYVWHQLSRDGKRLFVAQGWTSYVRTVDSSTGAELRPPRGHTAPVLAVAISPRGRALASVGQDRTVKLWDLGARRVRRSFATQADPSGALAFSHDGRQVAVATRDGAIVVWNASNGNEVQTLKGHSQPLLGMQFSPDEQKLAAGSETGAVILWDVGGAKEASRLPGHIGVVRCVAFSRSGRLLASGGEDKSVHLHDLATGATRQFRAQSPVTQVAFSPDAHILAEIGEAPEVRLWDLNSGKEKVWTGHTGNVHGVAFSPTAPLLATCGADGTVRLWDLTRDGDALVRTIGPGPFGGPVHAVAFTPDGRYLTTANANGMVYVLRMEDGR
jgi:WD40 repeat protein/serine/threonine protein kinase